MTTEQNKREFKEHEERLNKEREKQQYHISNHSIDYSNEI